MPAKIRRHPVPLSVQKGGEGRNGFTFRDQLVDRGGGIGVADRHSGDNDFVRGDRKDIADDAMVIAPVSLKTGIQSMTFG